MVEKEYIGQISLATCFFIILSLLIKLVNDGAKCVEANKI